MTQKYESDLTPKEKRSLEIQKIKSLKGKKKIEYLWTYYRSLLLVLLLIVAVIGTIVTAIQNKQRNPVLSLAVVDANYEADTAPLEEDLLKYLKASGKHDEVVINTTATSSGNNVKLAILLSVESNMDAVVCNPDVYNSYQQEGYFFDWKELLGDDYGNYEKYMTNGVIDLSKVPAWKNAEYTLYEPAYLAVLQNSKHTDAVLQFLKYFVEQ